MLQRTLLDHFYIISVFHSYSGLLVSYTGSSVTTPNIILLSILELVLGLDVYQFFLLNFAVISFRTSTRHNSPFKHRFIKKWVYGVMITIIWLVPSVMYTVLFEVI